jgi:polyisoprenoid-binding protein YceI
LSSAIEALACQVNVALPPASLTAASAHDRQMTYRLNERHGLVHCTVHQNGLFAMQGKLRRFSTVLAFALGETRLAKAEFEFDLTSFALDTFEQLGDAPYSRWLRLAEYPVARFCSTSVGEMGLSRHVIRGLLDIGGVTRLQALDLLCADPRKDPISGTQILDLCFTGHFRQAALGISLSDIVPSNLLNLRVDCTVELEG